MLKKSLLFTLCMSAMAVSHALEPFKLSDQGTVGFYIKKFGIKIVDATFGEVNSTVKFDSTQLVQTQINFTMQVPSIQPTTSSLKDMLLGEKYFNAAKYQQIVFDSTKIQALGRNKYNVFGNLTIKGKTRPVVFYSTITPNHIKATTQVQMKNFEMKSIADHVDIYVDGNLVQK